MPDLLPTGARRPPTLAETVDHLIARGVVLQGEVALCVAGTELVRLDLSAVLRALVRSSSAPHGGEGGGDAG